MPKKKQPRIAPRKPQPPAQEPRTRTRYVLTGLAVAAVAAVMLFVWPGWAVRHQQALAPAASAAAQDYTIQTSKGNIVVQVYPKLMPVTVANFEKLVKMHFYNNLVFWRVQNWLIQGGDPSNNGKGGPGWTIPLETNPKLKNVRGAIAMARTSNPNSAGSEFYILKTDAPWLNGKYAVFGKVIKGMSVVDKIQAGDKMITIRPGS